MLDQNTDRMWFVIGAVIVGAAIIFIANGALPSLFASVADNFEETASVGTEVISTMKPFDPTDLIIRDELIYGMWADEATGLLRDEESWTSHLFAVTPYIEVVPETTYVFWTDQMSSNKRMVFYDEDYRYIDGILNMTNTQSPVREQRMSAPINAKYARISANFSMVPVDQWWFGSADDFANR